MMMRPHIAMGWLLAIVAGRAFDSKRFGLLFAGAVGSAACIALLSLLKPTTFEEVLSDGPRTALSNRYDTLSSLDDANRPPIFGSKPIPVVSGMLLILSRPWPSETQAIDAFLAGLEVWLLGAFGLFNWAMVRDKRRLCAHPGLLTYVVLLLMMGFFFSYMYNMGLAVRQRLMCFPAMLAIYAWPLLARQRGVNLLMERRQRRTRTESKPRVKASVVRKALVPETAML